MDLKEYREQIDKVDRELVRLFGERMHIAAGVAEWKKRNNMPVRDPARERAKLKAVGEMAEPGMQLATEQLFSNLMSLARAHEHSLNAEKSPLRAKIELALAATEPLFPERASVACQGVEGAYSQIACQRMFKRPEIMHFGSFEGVFRAVEQGLCRYGVLPLENSTAGSVNRIYDLMAQYNFHIVRSARIKVDHCLLANKGVALSDIKEIVSHEQALAQCEGYLKTLPGVKITPVANTAVAAQMVATSGRRDLAALSSSSCAELYALSTLASGVQDSASNFTRFICISKNLEIYPGADTTSISMVLPHEPGSLYNTLGRFYALGVNLMKLESRPLPGSNFEFMFYFDLECSVYSDVFPMLFEGIEEGCSRFQYLGSYCEVAR